MSFLLKLKLLHCPIGVTMSCNKLYTSFDNTVDSIIQNN